MINDALLRFGSAGNSQVAMAEFLLLFDIIFNGNPLMG
jgi:hypothetical protein